MNLGQMKTELGLIIKDVSLAPLITGWINDAILEIATDYDLPPLALADPYTLVTDATHWLFSLPSHFHKKIFLAKYVSGTEQYEITVTKRYHHLLDEDHTDTGDHINRVAVIPQGLDFKLGVYPLAADTLKLWFYKKPATLVNDADVCDCIPFNYIPQVVYPKLVIKNYQFIIDQVLDFSPVPIQYWMGELKRGLQGAPGQGLGLLNYLTLNYHPPRRRGGPDPIGARDNEYGSF